MDYKDYKELILGELDQSLSAVNGQEVREMTEMILKAEKVFVTGVGRVFMMMEAFAKRLNHLGIEAYCVGDVNEPAVTKHDVLIAGSGSGESGACEKGKTVWDIRHPHRFQCGKLHVSI